MATSSQEPIIMFKWGSKLKPFRCQLCDMSFVDGAKMREHMNKHTDIEPKKPFPCKVCPKSFQTAKSLERHSLVHYGQAMKRCRFCYKVFANKENLDKHVEIHDGKKPFKCPQCGDEFVLKQGLESHMIIHTGVRPYVCQICDKGFNRKDILERHMLVHTGNKKYKCVECGKGFAHSFVLKRHMRAVHSQEFNGKECELCGKFIKSKENIRRHMKLHTGERPFKCSECGKSFSQKQHVIDHMVIHTGEYPHKCSQCAKEFKYKRSLNRHLQWHKGGSWKCDHPQCFQTYTSKQALDKHMKAHNEKKFQCDICQTLFKQYSALSKHYVKFHAQDLSLSYREIGVGTDDLIEICEVELQSKLHEVNKTEENTEAKELIKSIFENGEDFKEVTSHQEEEKKRGDEIIFIVLENDGQRQIVINDTRNRSVIPANTECGTTAGGGNELVETGLRVPHVIATSAEAEMDERSQLIQTLIDYAEKQRQGEQIAQADQNHVEAGIEVTSQTVNPSPSELQVMESGACVNATQSSSVYEVNTQSENSDVIELSETESNSSRLSRGSVCGSTVTGDEPDAETNENSSETETETGQPRPVLTLNPTLF